MTRRSAVAAALTVGALVGALAAAVPAAAATAWLCRPGLSFAVRSDPGDPRLGARLPVTLPVTGLPWYDLDIPHADLVALVLSQGRAWLTGGRP